MKPLAVIVILLLSLSAWADPPMHARKQAANDAAKNLLRACSETDNVQQCLVDRGATCKAVAGTNGDEFHCVTQITVEFSKLRSNSRPPESLDTFDVTYQIYMTKKGWKGRTRSVKIVDD